MIYNDNTLDKDNIYKMDSFELEYGRILRDVDVEYYTSGIPKYDDEGFITNAIIFCPTYKGTASVLREAHNYLKNNASFDKNEFFLIGITSLGLPNSYSPSSTELENNFSSYSIKDVVNFKRQFLAEKFKINKLLGIIGEEDGGYEVFTWACEYPDDMRFILVLNSDFKVSGQKYIIYKGYEAIIDLIEENQSGNSYSASLSKAIVAVNTFLFAQASSQKVINNLSNDEIEVVMEDFIDETLYMDIYDFNFRNSAVLNFDVEDQLGDIKARTLFIYSEDTVYGKPVDLDTLRESVDCLKIIRYETQKENYYDEEDYSVIGDEIISFITEVMND